ncbi:MAG TPA: hypothetical protein VGG82_03135 [Casimicrobiaceae bacterium]|jgi:hypothetical protein
MRRLLTFSLATVFAALSAIIFGALTAGVAHALDKVDTYICPTMHQGSGTDCFLEAIPQTYTMCRHIKSIEVIEFGLMGAEEGVNGAKTEGCIDKHKLSIARPYQTALREARNANEVQALRKLYSTWLDSLAKLRPASPETEEGYKLRAAEPYGDFNEQIKTIRELVAAPLPPSPKRPAKKAPAKS